MGYVYTQAHRTPVFYHENDGYKYLLVVIDIFSRYGWVQPLKDKSSNEVVKAFDKILTEGRKPKHLCTDAGREFTNNSFQEYLNVRHNLAVHCSVTPS